jgi:hypothetical protein
VEETFHLVLRPRVHSGRVRAACMTPVPKGRASLTTTSLPVTSPDAAPGRVSGTVYPPNCLGTVQPLQPRDKLDLHGHSPPPALHHVITGGAFKAEFIPCTRGDGSERVACWCEWSAG